jgi:acetolactate synthase-1/2/3 large subunit
MRAAELLIQTLELLGNRYLFSLSGNQIMPIYDALLSSNMELIHVRHEAAAVHMADAWGQLTGTPGVALVTAGPGFANTLSALYGALMAESPLLLLSGNAALKDLGHAPFQEMNQVDMAKSVTKASWMVTDPAQIGEQVQKAMRIAMDGRTAPVHLCRTWTY